MRLAATVGALLLLFASCSKKALGEECAHDGHCEVGYVCFRGVCNTITQRNETLNAQSGVGSAPPERPAAGGDRVKVRVTHGEGQIFAACAANERLLGGGCSGGDDCASEQPCHYLRSFPSAFTGEDTLGARWVCAGAEGTMQAYALCQATSQPASAPPNPSASEPPPKRP